jgi:hypothetical protein
VKRGLGGKSSGGSKGEGGGVCMGAGEVENSSVRRCLERDLRPTLVVWWGDRRRDWR